MKTNTTKLRRALTAFAMTGAMLAVSELYAQTTVVISDQTQGTTKVTDAVVNVDPNSAATIDAGENRLLTGSGTNTLNGTGYTFQNGISKGTISVTGGLISGGNWTITGGGFVGNNVVSGNPTNNNTSNAKGGAIYGTTVSVFGETKFSENIAKTGDPAKETKINNLAIGGAISTTDKASMNTVAITIGKENSLDNIVFSGNIADGTACHISSGGSRGGAVGGALGVNVGKIVIHAENGDSIIFSDNHALGGKTRALGGAIAAGTAVNRGKLEIVAEEGSTVRFENNTAVTDQGTYSAWGGAVYATNGIDLTNIEFVNNTVKTAGDGNYGAYGGAVAMPYNGILNIQNVTMSGNAAVAESKNGGAYGGAIVAAGTLQFSGENKFTNNTATSLNGNAKGGAIYGEEVAFVGDGSNAEFSGNTANGVNNDVHAESSVTFDGDGEYTFGGGITTGDNAGMDVNGSTLNFEAGSVTDIAGTVGLKDATLNITATDETVFNARDVKFNGGNNNANLTFAGTEQWTMGADFGDALVNKSSDFTTVKSENGKTVVSFRDAANGGSNFVAMTKDKTTGAAEFKGGAESMGTTYDTTADGKYELQENDYIIATADGKAPSAVSVDGLTIKSSDDTIRTITGDTGTVLSGISSVNLKNVTLKSGTAATIDTTKDLTVNADGKSTVDSINAASVKVGGNGQLIVNSTINSTINGSTEVLTGANLAISQRTNVTGDLTVDTGATLTLSDIAMTFEEVKDAKGNPVLENGKPVKTPVVDAIEIDGAISFADDAVIEISFDETFNLDAPGTYEIMKGDSLVGKGAEFSFVNAIAEMDGMQMLEVSLAQNGALMLNVKGFGTVPEPSTWALLILGGLGVFGVARKNRKAKK